MKDQVLYYDNVEEGEEISQQDSNQSKNYKGKRPGNVNVTTSLMSEQDNLKVTFGDNFGGLASPTSPTTYSHATDDINVKPTRDMLSPGAQTRRTFFNRAFGKLEKGSLRGSMLSLITSAVGVGILSLPYVFEIVGWGLGFVLLLIGCIAGIWSSLILSWMASQHKLNNYDQITRKASPWASRILSASIVIYGPGVGCSNAIILTTMAAYICTNLGLSEDFTSSMRFRAYVVVPLGYLVLFPLSSLRDISSLRYATMASIFALTYTCIVLVVECYWYNQAYKHKEGVEARIAVFDLNFFQGAAMIFFAYTCQMQLFPIYSELVCPTYRRIKKVVVRAFIFDFFIYGTVATVCYLSTFNYTNSLVLNRPPLDGFNPDYAMLVAAILIFAVVFASYPLYANPWRNQLLTICLGMKQYSNKVNFIVTFSFVTFTVLIAIFVPNLSKVITILGGLCSCTFSFTLPAFCWIKLSPHPWYQWFNVLTVVFLGSLAMIGYLSVVATIYEMTTGNPFIGDRPDIQGI